MRIRWDRKCWGRTHEQGDSRSGTGEYQTWVSSWESLWNHVYQHNWPSPTYPFSICTDIYAPLVKQIGLCKHNILFGMACTRTLWYNCCIHSFWNRVLRGWYFCTLTSTMQHSLVHHQVFIIISVLVRMVSICLFRHGLSGLGRSAWSLVVGWVITQTITYHTVANNCKCREAIKGALFYPPHNDKHQTYPKILILCDWSFWDMEARVFFFNISWNQIRLTKTSFIYWFRCDVDGGKFWRRKTETLQIGFLVNVQCSGSLLEHSVLVPRLINYTITFNTVLARC